MKNLLKQIIPSLWLVASLGFPATASPQVLTARQIQQVNSDLFPSNSQDFFLQGNRQLEQEIKILLHNLLNSEGEILEIDEKLRSELCDKDFKISSHTSDTINAAQISSVNTKVKDICSHN